MRLGFKYNDIDLVRQDIKSQMPLDQFIILADKRYTDETGIKCNPLEEVNDHLYKKCCDLDEHPLDDDGTRDSTASFTVSNFINLIRTDEVKGMIFTDAFEHTVVTF